MEQILTNDIDKNSIEKKDSISSNLSRKEAIIFLVCGAVLSFFYSICFSGIDVVPQLSFSVFCPIAFLILTAVLKYIGLLNNKKALLLIVPVLIVSVFNSIFNLNLFSYSNVLVMHVLFAVFVYTAINKQNQDLFSLNGLIILLRTMAGNWIVIFSAFHMLSSKKHNDSGSKTGRKILIGVSLAVPVLFLIIPLLMSADMVFDKLATNFISNLLIIDRINIPFLLSVAIAWIYAAGYVYQSKKIAQGVSSIEFPNINGDKVICATFLIIVNTIFLLFTLVQVAYLFTGGLMTLPEGMVYSQYAREGFFQLLFVTVINFSVIIVFMCVLKGTAESKLLTFLMLMLCGFTGVLIASSFYRMYLYIDVFGHTILRLSVLTFLFMEVVLICITVLKLLNNKIPFIKWFVITCFVFYLAVNYSGSDYLATKLNINMFLSGKIDSIDVRPIGKDGLSLLKPMFENENYICQEYLLTKKEKAIATLKTQSYDDIRRINTNENQWQNWSYFEHTLKSTKK